MGKASSHALQITRRIAAVRVRQLIDEFQMLMSAFPDLHDAFDPDELPIEFILKRDSQLEPSDTPNPVPPAVTPMTRSMPAHFVEHRQKKPGADD